MVKKYDDTNRGVLFRNDRKGKDSHPDWNGKINVEGYEYDLSAWVKKGKNGEFFSLSIRPKEPRPSFEKTVTPPRPAPAHTSPQEDDFDDEVPF